MDNLQEVTQDQDEMRPEYDETILKNGVRGKYYQRYMAGTNLVRLAPDVRKAFPSDEDVDRALRSLMENNPDVLKVPTS